MTTYAGIEAISDLIVSLINVRNDVVAATITADLGLVNSTPLVSVSVGGATRVAVYACPNAIQTKACWVTQTHAGRGADLIVIATNYQADTGGGAVVPNGALTDADGAALVDADAAYLTEAA